MSDKWMKIAVLVFLAYLLFKNIALDKNIEPDIKPVVPIPINVEPKPAPDNPSKYFFENDYVMAEKTSVKYGIDMLIIFGADWCPYCVELKKIITQQDYAKLGYVVCYLDTDNKTQNQEVMNKFKPRSLPTSIKISGDNAEIKDKKIGYSKDYLSWLQGK